MPLLRPLNLFHDYPIHSGCRGRTINPGAISKINYVRVYIADLLFCFSIKITLMGSIPEIFENQFFSKFKIQIFIYACFYNKKPQQVSLLRQLLLSC